MEKARIEIKAVKADNITFINKLEPGKTISLSFKYTYNIIYSGGGGGRAELTLTAENKTSPDSFKLSVTETGIFTCPADMPRETVHIMTFRALFPYAKALAAMVTSAAGMPAVMIPEIDLSSEDVMRIDLRPPEQNNDAE